MGGAFPSPIVLVLAFFSPFRSHPIPAFQPQKPRLPVKKRPSTRTSSSTSTIGERLRDWSSLSEERRRLPLIDCLDTDNSPTKKIYSAFLRSPSTLPTPSRSPIVLVLVLELELVLVLVVVLVLDFIFSELNAFGGVLRSKKRPRTSQVIRSPGPLPLDSRKNAFVPAR
jgi:hypothetical protein